jgi:hypothetical protein
MVRLANGVFRVLMARKVFKAQWELEARRALLAHKDFKGPLAHLDQLELRVRQELKEALEQKDSMEQLVLLVLRALKAQLVRQATQARLEQQAYSVLLVPKGKKDSKELLDSREELDRLVLWATKETKDLMGLLGLLALQDQLGLQDQRDNKDSQEQKDNQELLAPKAQQGHLEQKDILAPKA